MNGGLAHQMKLLKLARLCNPIWLIEVHPQLDELVCFKVVTSEHPPTILQQLKDELPLFLALASDINELHFDIESIVPFSKVMHMRFPHGHSLHPCWQHNKSARLLWRESFPSSKMLLKRHKKKLFLIMYCPLLSRGTTTESELLFIKLKSI